ncbi:TPA: hypothetical protein PIU55_004227 [Klebsiella quasipneumoniae subsp. quasipneumoniae]|nr:hypothetical protein [Klebsiella quasipneumoniae subsp. quasipneumoniae]HBR1675116.1 hypothetical protein [Klebsiella quasipneumoniae subsp. quasipneumoniae]HBV4315533.1 hypothetical protein [Klebsiella quasipneumoniae]HCI6850628.1 hypothetical protein [Klebsiella quasipneumoniae subsp. quasipneumoniae]HDH1545540.1 hypothetical protein [Klebsiella quasipneumoniae subsp. quasipneumoniae]
MPVRKTLANAIHALSMDAVLKVKSGHPDAPMGMADIEKYRYYLHTHLLGMVVSGDIYRSLRP